LHHDYHIGFQDTESCVMFPKAMQVASQFPTLPGAVAHSDMPIESGPTRLLPFSQKFEKGYMAYRIPEFQNYFLKKYVSVPLEKGDGLFFNHALFHATDQNNSVALCALQISCRFLQRSYSRWKRLTHTHSSRTHGMIYWRFRDVQEGRVE
jgi:ectoine hydroxylase-related dioxygenase (phytanoyl-CoA dioxygenase family)